MTMEDDTRKLVLDCIRRLTNDSDSGMCEYKDIIRETGLSPHIVKDRCTELIERTQEVLRVSRGFYKAVKIFPPSRPISKTALSDGEVILEVGDTVLHLTPAEERMMRGMFGNATVEFQQVAPPVVQQQKQPAVAPAVMTLDDVAAVFNVSRRVARDKITKERGFPATIPGSTERKPLWAKGAIMGYLLAPA